MRKSDQKLIGCLAIAVVALVTVVGGVAALLFWGWGMYVDQVKSELNGNPVIQEHIGTIEDLSVNLVASSELDDENTFVFDVKGDKGEGVVTAELVSIDADTEELRSGTLELTTGETYDLLE